MKLILQGMRRSGTTIIYDALAQDQAWTLWYEPLAAANNPAIGGGSQARDVDVFADLRVARQRFAQDTGLPDTEELNFGAPRDTSLEFLPDMPCVIKEYLQFLINHPGPVAAKFTRLYAKVPLVHELFPTAGFVHLVRDPRAVAVSYLFGKNRRYEEDTRSPRVFFGRRSKRSAWSSFPFSEQIRQEYLHENLPEPTDLERILLVWKYTFQRVRDALPSTYGNRGIMVRHEDFCANPVVELGRMYSLVERKVTEPVVSWACSHLRKPAPIHCDGDRRWRLALERMKMVELVQACGYEV